MEYYVTLINPNSKELEYYNIFQNAYVAEDIENYKHDWNLLKINRNNLIMVLDQTFHYAYWGRCQYEIIVSDLFDAMKPEKIDAYYQIKPNIPVIADMLIKEWEIEFSEKVSEAKRIQNLKEYVDKHPEKDDEAINIAKQLIKEWEGKQA